MNSVLFVCLGNICRSPTAHGVFAHRAAQAGLHYLRIDSAGTIALHQGDQPDKRSQAAAKTRGFDLSSIRSRPVVESDFFDFDLILAMDKQNLADLQKMKPQGATAQLKLFLSYGQTETLEVPDPYYGGARGFEHVLDLVEDAAQGLLLQFKE